MSKNTAKPFVYWLYIAIFTLSGFSGLIYESIWTRYLKLFLGSAAFAQAFTLAIFMGGMAIGAWAAARYGRKSARLLLWYALAEMVVGVAAMTFHPVFKLSTGLAYDWLFPAVGFSAAAVFTIKWGIASMLILPQSILLGATFPLMTAGIIRRFPDTPGVSVATLYFVNSLGGAVGVLVSGFYLLDSFGLPGTVMIAGAVNMIIAVVVMVTSMDRSQPGPATPTEAETNVGEVAWITWRVLVCAGLTGAASFLYEIGWIRMLSLVLGSSARAFELMLSAFILGLALGGYFIRRKIESIENHLFALAEIQVAMGALALITVHIYGGAFTAMATLMTALAKTPEGYVLFNLSSHAIAMVIMLPATIMAGMTLPLMTHFLFLRGEGEASIGKVYAANTIGAIIGVALGVLLVMPLLGLKYVILAGAAIDIVMGLWLFLLSGKEGAEKKLVTVAAFGLAAIITTILFARMDPLKMASGVYRSGKLLEQGVLAPYHKDGRTASVDFIMTHKKDPTQVISTNGKPDSSIGLYSATSDEPVMILLAALGWDINPVEATVAVVGMGAGLSSHVALSIPSVKQVDTIEIEPAMVEGARLFKDRVAKVFSDPKSKIYIDDAKSFFASSPKQYDLIIAEPSNPWVAGVAGLFSTEFYALARKSLADNGILVQWIQLYEIEPELVAGIMKALSANFEDYTLFQASSGDLIVVAS
ncbi:MAG: spermidine synthase, partial [Nitrospinota bacterium]|nr:spermidine synthase [Nitrospinota bacterium]